MSSSSSSSVSSARVALGSARVPAAGAEVSVPIVVRTARAEAEAKGAAATRVGVYSRTVPPAGAAWRHRAMPSQAAAAAHELFAVLRDFDAQGAEAIWVEAPPETVEWEGVRDRLQRAAAG